MTRIPTALCFDVEDIIAPESDDAVLWQAEILAEHGLTGSFMIVGERARQWERRGRRDVIEALKKHHLGFHSTWHSVHPTTAEICQHTNFAAGMDAVWEWDRQGWADTERIFGRPLLGWSRTGDSWCPSVMGLMGRLGRGYAYSSIRLPGHNVHWYANCLGFFSENVGIFDHTLYSDAEFEERLALTHQRVDRHAQAGWRRADWMCLFMCHPTRVIHAEFWDGVNFAKGANPPPADWKPARRHPDALLPTMQKNYRRLCEWLRADPRLEIVGWGDLLHRYDGQKASAAHDELAEIARRIAAERGVLFTDHWTAGEILLLLCRASLAPAPRYPRPTVNGPLSVPPPTLAADWDAAAIRAAAGAVLDASAATGCLPPSVEVAGQAVGLGTYFVALAEAFLGRARVSGPADAPYPLEADAITRAIEPEMRDWPVHTDGMDLENLLEQARLQCWALKPAWPRDALSARL